MMKRVAIRRQTLRFTCHQRLFLLMGLMMAALLLAHSPTGPIVNASSEEKVKGQPSRAAQDDTSSAAEGGTWSGLQLPGQASLPTVSMKTVPVHISLLPSGKIIYWGRDKDPVTINQQTGEVTGGADVSQKSNTYIIDPLYPELEYTAVKNTATNGAMDNGTNLFCSGHSFLPDGRLIVSGGHDKIPGANDASAEGVGDKHINIFDYQSETWTPLPQQMENGRWYPYHATLANGETLIVSGSYWATNVFKNNRDTNVRDLSNQLRLLQGDTNNRLLPNYPYIFLTPGGLALVLGFQSGLNSKSYLYDPYAQNNPGLGRYTDGPNLSQTHSEGSAVMYAPGKVLVLGGLNTNAGGAPTNTAEQINLNEGSPAWSSAGAMSWARRYPTATVLPDGNVLVTGGTSCAGTNSVNCGPGGANGGAVQTPEMWNPSNPTVWMPKTPTSSGIPRVYHSVALLLPDGKVLVGGGGLPAATGEVAPPLPGQPGGNVVCQGGLNDPLQCKHFGHKDYELFSPPYLYDANGALAPRPVITTAPSSIAYGQTFPVGVGGVSASDIKEVVLIRLPSVTHTFNQDQRRVVLQRSINGDTLSVTGPADGYECPPGPYMMFLISANGRNTPSVAKIVRVGNISIDATSRAFTAGTQQGGTINVTAAMSLNWAAQVSPDATSWLSITSGSNGFGNGAINFSVAPNTMAGASRRSGRITVRVPGQDMVPLEFNVYQGSDFSDVPVTKPQYASINKIFARGITSGCGNGRFCPGDPLTRIQAAVFLTTVLNPVSLPYPVTGRFRDTADNPAYRKVSEYLYRRGIAAGCGNGNFCPDQPLTRRDLCIWLIAALGIDPPQPSTRPFNDVPLSDYGCRFIAEAQRRGITSGCGNGNFCPDNIVTREEAAVFLSIAFSL